MPKKIKNKKAFTLIELLVVVIIIGVLSAIALPQYFKALDKARFVQILTFTDALLRAEQSYFLLNGKYTKNINALDVDIPNIKDVYCYIDTGSFIGCYLYKNGKKFIILEKYFDGPDKGEEYCCSYSDTDFKGDDLCISTTNNTTRYRSTSSYHCYEKK